MKKMLRNAVDKFTICTSTSVKRIKGTMVLVKKNVLDFDDFESSILDDLHELVAKKDSLQLIGSINTDPSNELKGRIGEKAYLEEWITTISSLTAEESSFKVTFDWGAGIGFSGAIKNNHHRKFYLKSLALEDVPAHGQMYFDCNSWV